LELTAAESSVMISMHRIVSEIDRRTKVICQKHSLTFGQFMVLEAIYHKGPLTVGEVKKSILSTDGTIPVIVANLEKAGFLVRNTDDKDRRKCILALTDKGTCVIEETYPDNAAMIHEAFSVWTPEELKELGRLLNLYRVRRR
jgi:MarR family 2-MHQ and catechol resistance regulon transcriptional repressor